MKSLSATASPFVSSKYQLQVLNQQPETQAAMPAFAAKLAEHALFPLHATGLRVFQVNVGKMCNQVCRHCHVDAGPDRQEIMTRETMQLCLDVLRETEVELVDITGGAPEMNPDFRWFVEQLSRLQKKILVRCNLTIIVANPKYHDLPEFFRQHRVQVVSSLPHFAAARTNAQRGEGVFERSVKALQMLNAVGYGQENSGLQLDLVYNPAGAFLPAGQAGLEKEFRQRLQKQYQISFNNLLALTNLPVSRFLEYLVASNNYEAYMAKLLSAFNPVAAANVMCRNTISVSWDGLLFDCDFNQMLDLPVAPPAVRHLRNFNAEILNYRPIVLNQHCYGCTAGAGSSCGGETVRA